MPRIHELTPDDFPRLAEFWRESFPLHPLTDELLRERVFGPRDAAPERSLCYLDGEGRIIALSLLVPPGGLSLKVEDENLGGIRWFGVHPEHRQRGLGKELMEESLARLKSMGATVVEFLATPPYYIQPGIDTRFTDAIAWLERRGFERYRENANMTVDLEIWTPPDEKAIYEADAAGYSLRRARASDESFFMTLCKREWTESWGIEAWLGVKHSPVSLVLATNGDSIVGFAAYEVNQCTGCFGPTGVSPDHQGHGLGKRLLWATLLDMKRLGRKECQIGWIGPADFYARACGAVMGPKFYGMRKRLV